jgi:hypothetical protein
MGGTEQYCFALPGSKPGLWFQFSCVQGFLQLSLTHSLRILYHLPINEAPYRTVPYRWTFRLGAWIVSQPRLARYCRFFFPIKVLGFSPGMNERWRVPVYSTVRYRMVLYVLRTVHRDSSVVEYKRLGLRRLCVWIWDAIWPVRTVMYCTVQYDTGKAKTKLIRYSMGLGEICVNELFCERSPR